MVCYLGGKKGEKYDYGSVCLCVFTYICEKTTGSINKNYSNVYLWGKKKETSVEQGQKKNFSECTLLSNFGFGNIYVLHVET